MDAQDETVLVSVVIPAFNPGDLIFQTVDSVLSQTLPGVECIVIDNGSTDGLARRLSRYGDRIKVVRFETNRRPAAARNEGIRRSSGRYIALLDADDVWHPQRLERLVSYLEEHPDIGFATTDSLLLVDGQPTSRSYFSTTGTRFHDQDQDVHIFAGNFLSNLLIFRRELFDRYGLFDEESWCEDWAKNIEFIMGGEKAGIVREPLAYYRITPGSLSKSSERMTADSLKILESWRTKPVSRRVRRAIRRSYGRTSWDRIKIDLLAGRKSSVRARLLHLTWSGPWDVKAKALVWLILPGRLVSRVHSARAKFIQEGGGAWILQEAAAALRSGDRERARKSIAAAVVFGYPLRTRVTAALWLLVPPARRSLTSRLLSDPVLKEFGP